MAVTKMIERGLLEEIDTNIRKGEPLWRETGDGHGTTLKVTGAGLAAIGIEAEMMLLANQPLPNTANPARPALRLGTKQAHLIALLEAPAGATMETFIAATG